MKISISQISPKSLKKISQGAEAEIYQGIYLKRDVVIKIRKPKPYLNPAMDENLKRARTKSEARNLIKAKINHVNVPRLFLYDRINKTIVMEFIEGKVGKSINEKRVFDLMITQLGQQVAKLHSLDIIHGDITTSNIILDNKEMVHLLDFGLSKVSPQLEDKAIDLLVLKKTMITGKNIKSKTGWELFLEGYASINPVELKRIVTRLEKIEKRVRYRNH